MLLLPEKLSSLKAMLRAATTVAEVAQTHWKATQDTLEKYLCPALLEKQN